MSSAENLGPDELVRDWTLSEADLVEVFGCRGEVNRLWFAVQLLAIRRTGRFVGSDEELPGRTLNHVCAQLDAEPVLFLAAPERQATVSELRARIVRHLGLRPFDTEEREELERWLAARAVEGVGAGDLVDRVERMLVSRKVVLPDRAALEAMAEAAAAYARRGALEVIAGRLPAETRRALDELLAVPEGGRSRLWWLQRTPTPEQAGELVEHRQRLECLDELGLHRLDWGEVGAEQVRHLAERGRRYDARSWRRFSPEQRYPLLACVLVELRRQIIDQLVVLHDRYQTKIVRRAKNRAAAQVRRERRESKAHFAVLESTQKILEQGHRSWESRGEEFDRTIGAERYGEALSACRRAVVRGELEGFLEELDSSYSDLRRYLPGFFELEFRGETGTRPLLEGLELARELNDGRRRKLPSDAPLDFVPKDWVRHVRGADGSINRRLWELALAGAVKGALRSGDLHLADSRRHLSFSELVYDPQRWERERTTAYADLALPTEADRAVAELKRRHDEAIRRFLEGLPSNPFAYVERGRLRLHREPALLLPPEVAELRDVVGAHYPQVRIERLLETVDDWCGFTRAFRPLPDYRARGEGPDRATFLAALVAHGTNLGLAAMGRSAEGISVDALAHVTQWYLREETHQEGTGIMVDYHRQLPASSLWGTGKRSSSDGQRFRAPQSLLGSFYPRYFGYYRRAVNVYTWVSDQHAIFHTLVMACSEREAPYVLDGMQGHILPITEHTTDTGGYVEILFGLCYLLGITFMPRIAKLGKQKLYKLDRDRSYGPLDSRIRETIDLGIVREQWDSLVRLAASIRNGTAPAHLILRRLLSDAPADRLVKALRALSRVVKTINLLTYVHDPEVRLWVRRTLNYGEFRKFVAQHVFFANQGRFRDGTPEMLMNKATCLSLLCNAILVWNTLHFPRIVARLRAGGAEVPDEHLAWLPPLAFNHVLVNGTYSFKR